MALLRCIRCPHTETRRPRHPRVAELQSKQGAKTERIRSCEQTSMTGWREQNGTWTFLACDWENVYKSSVQTQRLKIYWLLLAARLLLCLEKDL